MINKHVKRIRGMFKWGVSEELFGPAVYQALQAVPPLKKGRTRARETPGVEAVSIDTRVVDLGAEIVERLGVKEVVERKVTVTVNYSMPLTALISKTEICSIAKKVF